MSRFKKYNPGNFDHGYFSNYESFPSVERARLFKNYFLPVNALDAGCGTGNLVWGFRRLGVTAFGVDQSEIPIHKASEEIRPCLRVGDILNLNFPGKEFDLVTCCDVLEHIPFPECGRAVDELYRITRKWLLFSICLWTEKNARMDPTHINLHSKKWWGRYFKRKGFTLETVPEGFPSLRNSFIVRKS